MQIVTSIQLVWLILLCLCLIGLVIVWCVTDDWLLWRLRFLKRRDTDLQLSNIQIVGGLVIVLLLGSLVLYLADIPLSISMTLLGATVYLTATFYCNCCLFHAGARRELLWALFFVAVCLASLLLTSWLRIEWIIPLGAPGSESSR